jgi:hypothetical protein
LFGAGAEDGTGASIRVWQLQILWRERESSVLIRQVANELAEESKLDFHNGLRAQHNQAEFRLGVQVSKQMTAILKIEQAGERTLLVEVSKEFLARRSSSLRMPVMDVTRTSSNSRFKVACNPSVR